VAPTQEQSRPPDPDLESKARHPQSACLGIMLGSQGLATMVRLHLRLLGWGATCDFRFASPRYLTRGGPLVGQGERTPNERTSESFLVQATAGQPSARATDRSMPASYPKRVIAARPVAIRNEQPVPPGDLKTALADCGLQQ
jgi:hypothetical protein